MASTYLDLDYKTNQFAHFSKTKLNDDYEAFHKADGGHGGYKKYYPKGVFGILQSVRTIETKMGEKLSLSLKTSEGYVYISVPLFDSKGNFDNRFALPLICTLPNLMKGGTYRFFPWKMEREDKPGFFNTGFSIKLANLDDETVSDKVPMMYSYAKPADFVAGQHIPNLDFVEKRGKFRPTASSIETRQDFLEDILEIECERLKSDYNPNSSSTATETATETATASAPNQGISPASPSEAFPPAGNVNNVADDDLPF